MEHWICLVLIFDLESEIDDCLFRHRKSAQMMLRVANEIDVFDQESRSSNDKG